MGISVTAVVKSVLCVSALGLACAVGAQAPEGAGGQLAQGSLLYAQKDYDQALNAYVTSLKQDGPTAYGYQGVGNCLLAKGDKADALKYYRFSLQMSQNNSPLRVLVARLEASLRAAPAAGPLEAGKMLYRAGRFDEAIAALTRAAANEPSSAEVHQLLGNCYYEKLDRPNALAQYRMALALNPGNASLRAFVAGLEASPDGARTAGGWGQAAWRSAVLPGWGQAYNGQNAKAWTVGLVTLGFLAATTATYIIGENARNQYLSLDSPNANYDAPYNTWGTMAGLNNAFYIATLAAYSYGIVDAIACAKSNEAVALAPVAGPVSVAAMPGGVKFRVALARFN